MAHPSRGLLVYIYIADTLLFNVDGIDGGFSLLAGQRVMDEGRIVAEDEAVAGRRPPNNSLNRTGISLPIIRKIECLVRFFPPG
jgi:hypothetical protein